MKRLLAAGALTSVLLWGCAQPPPALPSAPLCAAGDVNVYVLVDTRAHCRLSVGQRYVIIMPKANGTDAALRTVCIDIWKGTEFIFNFGDYHYCVMPKKV